MTGTPDPQDVLVRRVLTALLREDAAGLRTRSVRQDRADGTWLRLPLPDGGALALPVAEDGFQGTWAARLPLLRREPSGRELATCDAVLAALREAADPQDRTGYAAFARECRQALAAMRLHETVRPAAHAVLTARYGADPARWHGHRGTLAFDTLAAYLDHPVYPASRGRAGLTEPQLRSCAPEFHPSYRPRWIVLPHRAVTAHGLPEHPDWPVPSALGLSAALDAGHLALPVHPLTGDRALREALGAVGLADRALPGCGGPRLVPTLSMRTGAFAADPAVHLKLPLATATLGLLNRRTIKPGTLRDGALCQRLLEAVIAREPRFAGRVLLADESRWAHAGHEMLGALLRVMPAGLEDAVVVPMAALPAPAPDGVPVLDHLARRFAGGDPLALLDRVWRLLFDWQTTLFGYGIALESHQQNVALVLDRPGGTTRVRLLLKDNDGPRVDAATLSSRLGGPPPAFADRRVFAEGSGPLAALFTTITVHLCAAAYVFGLAEAGRVPLRAGLDLLRDRLARAVDRLPPGPRAELRARVLTADRLPVKAMVTAGSLLSKARSGAADINKHYTDGPNYLLPPGSRPPRDHGPPTRPAGRTAPTPPDGHVAAPAPPAGRPAARPAPPPTAPAPAAPAAPAAASASSAGPDRGAPAPTELPTADEVVAHTLLNCLLREVCGPRHRTGSAEGRLLLRLPATGTLLRVAVRRASLLGAHRFTGPAGVFAGGCWREIGWRELGERVQAELNALTGTANDEFPGQLASSHAGVTAGLAARATRPPGRDRYLESERSLLFGHRFHPTPKARSADRAAWRAYAPETGAAFPLRLLAVRRQRVAEERAWPGAAGPLDRLHPVPDGYRLLPAHPWQYELLCGEPLLRTALRRGDVLDLGPGGPVFAPTASVRTLAGDNGFLKFSLNVRITNCLRKNARYELSGAVALTRLLGPVFDELARRHPGSAMLREPAYRSLALPGPGGDPDRGLLEGFGVIVREGLAGRLRPGVTALLAAAVADEYPTGPAHLTRLPAGRDRRVATRWWARYLRLLVPPVLEAFFRHGVVLEPHLQNVLIGVDGDGMPAQVLLRDLEGTKLLAARHAAALAALPADVAGPLGYDEQRGWDRVVYCLLVNNAAETLAALADRHPGLEPRLWAEVRAVLAECATDAGRPDRLRALLAGAPLPAKANLLTRWHRRPDRAAGYVRLPSPLAAGAAAGPARRPA